MTDFREKHQEEREEEKTRTVKLITPRFSNIKNPQKKDEYMAGFARYQKAFLRQLVQDVAVSVHSNPVYKADGNADKKNDLEIIVHSKNKKDMIRHGVTLRIIKNDTEILCGKKFHLKILKGEVEFIKGSERSFKKVAQGRFGVEINELKKIREELQEEAKKKEVK